MLLTDMRNTLSHQHIIFVPKDEFITCHWGSPSDVIGGSPSELPGKSCVKSSDVLLGASCLSFLGEAHQSSCGSFSPDTADHLSSRESLKTLLHKDSSQNAIPRHTIDDIWYCVKYTLNFLILINKICAN